MMRFFVCLPFLAVFTAAFQCPSGFTQFPREERCLLPLKTVEYYPGAVRGCQGKGLQLVKIRNAIENSFVWAKIADVGNNPYIGIERSAQGNWIYTDGTPLGYQAWAAGEPNTTNPENICAILDRQNGLWKTSKCSEARQYFCSSNDANTPNVCPDGWTYFNGTAYCYYLQKITYPPKDSPNSHLPVQYSRQESESNCQKMNSHLASIHSKLEEDFIYDLISSRLVCGNDPVWIGLFGTGALGNGNWTDGTNTDYMGTTLPGNTATNWMITNNPTCSSYDRRWKPQAGGNTLPRFLCKLPTKG